MNVGRSWRADPLTSYKAECYEETSHCRPTPNDRQTKEAHTAKHLHAAADASVAAAEVAAVRTFLIADVRGYTAFTQQRGDEAAAALAAKFARLAREVVEVHGGRVMELRGDEALAVFTSARAAVRAAMDMQDRFSHESVDDPQLPVHVGVGLDVGEAVPVEGGYRGGALNLAARLCSLAAPTEVLVSGGIVHLTGTLVDITYDDRGVAALKGFAEPVHVFQVRRGYPARQAMLTKALDPSTDQPPIPAWPASTELAHLPVGGFLGALPEGALIGRDEELSRILPTIDAVAAGGGRLVLVTGEPGVGKTRLAQEVTRAVRNRKFLVAAGRCYEAYMGVPYYPFRDVLSTIARCYAPATQHEIAARWPGVGRLLPGPEQAPMASGLGIEAKEEQQHLFWSVASFLQWLTSAGPLAIMVDDLQWADSASLELLQHLSRHLRAQPVLILGTYRDVEVGPQHPLEQALRNLARERLIERLPIKRLPVDGTGALISATAGASEVPRELVESIYGRTEGNPFFVEEIVRALVERGIVSCRGSALEWSGDADIDVPESVRSVIAERLARLGPDAQHVLRAASVLGGRFCFDHLRAMTGLSEESVEIGLEQARSAGLVRDMGDDTYTFHHALTQQALYRDLPARRRKRMHRAAAESLEESDARESLTAELARHFSEADDPVRALTYALLAGAKAESVFAHADAERQYRSALELARELGDRQREAEALLGLGMVLRLLARYEQGLECLELAADLYGEVGNAEAMLRTVAHIGKTHTDNGTSDHGIERLEPVVQSLQGSGVTVGVAMIYASLGHLYFRSGRFADSVEAATRAADMARQLGDSLQAQQILSEAEVRRGSALTELGRFEEGIRVMEAAIPLAEAAGNPEDAFTALNNVGHTHVALGNWTVARACLERALRLAERLGDPSNIAFSRASLGNCLFGLGDWARTRAEFEKVADLLQAFSCWFPVYPLFGNGRLALAEGNWVEARGYLEEALAVAERGKHNRALFGATTDLAELDVLEGRAPMAIARLAPIVDDPDFPPEMRPAAHAVLAWAHLQMARAPDQLAEAERLVGVSVDVARSEGVRPDLMCALWVQGMVLTAQERWVEAEQALTEAVSVARDIGYPYGEARALRESGVLNMRRGDVHMATPRLEEALTVFERLGARQEAVQTQSLLSEVVS